jgi:hypothetical protein
MSYTSGNIIVFLNGASLDSTDYTATNGTSVVLGSAASLNDEVVIVAFKSFTVADTYTQSQVDALLAGKIGTGSGTVSQSNLATNVAGTGPAFRAYQTSAQSVSAGTFTKVAFSAEDFDTSSSYDTSTYRFQPTLAGYYQINCHLLITAGTSISRVILRLTKNGAESGSNGRTVDMTITAGQAIIFSASDLFYLNGSSDYIEVFGYVTGSGVFTFGSNDANTSVFTGALVRAA